MTPKHFAALTAVVTFALLSAARLLQSADGPPTNPAGRPPTEPRLAKHWFKGNLHTHSLWSDGDEFPERIAAWYRDRGYHFLAISDHNTLQQGEKWVRSADLKKKGALPATEKYLKDFADLARTRGDVAGGSFEVRLTPFDEFKPKLDRPGRFLLVQSEEVSAKFGAKPVHLCATNLSGEVVQPQAGGSVVEVIRNNVRAIEEQGRKSGKPVLPHLNHPNFRWGVTAEEMAAVVEERFFEVYNGHPQVGHEGDKDHPGVERMWDVANTIRMTTLNAPPMYGVGTDDSHHYHVAGMNRSTVGRGWVQVRATELTPAALIAAMKAGDFYASSGVALADVRYDAAAGTLTVKVQPDGGATYITRFVGTPAPPAGGQVPAGEIGTVFATVEGAEATYKLTGRELYVRAVVTADQPAANPSFKGQMKQAWTQPVGWEKRVK